MIRTVTIEDDARYRASLEALFAHSPDFTLVRSFADPAAALAEVDAALSANEQPAWDLVLMDLDLPVMSGVECTRRLKVLLPDTQIVVLTVFEERGSIVEAICAGADGYVAKRTPADALLGQLRAVTLGGSPLSAGIARTVLDLLRVFGRDAARVGASDLDPAAFTAREHDVLRCLANGSSYKRIAADLGVSIDTVRSHIRSIYSKMRVHTTAEAVGRALRSGLV